VRLDFFDNVIEDMRAFDPVTQRSGERVSHLRITAAPTVEIDAAPRGFASHLGTQAAFFLVEPALVEETLSRLAREAGEATFYDPHWLKRHFLDERPTADGDAWFALAELDTASVLLTEIARSRPLVTEALSFHRPATRPDALADSYWGQEREIRGRFFSLLDGWRAEGLRILFVFPREGEEQRAREILAEEGPPSLTENAAFLRGTLAEGVRIDFAEGPPPRWPALLPEGTRARPPKGLVFVTEAEFFGRRAKPRVRSRKRTRKVQSQVDQMLDFTDLAEGDHVVHLQHGIGIFRGVRSVEAGGQTRETIAVEFDEGVVFHVPMHESHLLTRYVGVSRQRPTLGKLGSGRWEKDPPRRRTLRPRPRRKAPLHPGRPRCAPGLRLPSRQHLAARVRGLLPPPRDPRPDPRDRRGEGRHGEAEADGPPRLRRRGLRQDRGRDPRRVQGRHGRAPGRRARAHHRARAAAPQQLPRTHGRLPRLRRDDEPLPHARASRPHRRGRRFRQGRHPHRHPPLLSEDVKFRDLGLVVIDEEQRFGVKHKERLKELRASVDVLSMSATPIPRTLYLALTGARDLSVIETPPANRLPIQTIVKTYDLKLIVEAIRFEVRRGGQVFYLHNRVQTIETVAASACAN
jgi:transcription-repair coupling factor (superfamily II helicase)